MLKEIDDVLEQIEQVELKLNDCKIAISNGDEPDSTQKAFLKEIGIEIEEQ